MKWSIQINGEHFNNENLSSIDDPEIRTENTLITRTYQALMIPKLGPS